MAPKDWKPKEDTSQSKDKDKSEKSENKYSLVTQQVEASQAMSTTGQNRRKDWAWDTGTFHHITCNRFKLYDIQPSSLKVEGVNGISHAACKGKTLIETDVNGGKVNLELTEVRYLPEAAINLVSHRRLRAMGGRILDQGNILQLTLNNTTIAYVDADQNNLFFVRQFVAKSYIIQANPVSADEYTWHRWFGHMN